MIRTHYETLQVTRTASDAVIRAAYKSLAQNFHPDKFDGAREEAERVMKLLNSAYAILSDPTLRKQYDEWIERESAVEQAHSPAGAAKAKDVARSVEPHVHASTEFHQKIVNEMEFLRSGRLGGLFCLGLSLIGLSFFGLSESGPDRPDRVYFTLGSAAWAAFFGYLSYFFYSGRANLQFGRFRLALTMAGIGLAEAVIFAIFGDENGWKVALGMAAAVFFSVAAWREYRRVRRI